MVVSPAGMTSGRRSEQRAPKEFERGRYRLLGWDRSQVCNDIARFLVEMYKESKIGLRRSG